MYSKQQTSDLNKEIGLTLIGKYFIKKLNRFIEKGAKAWDVPASSIVMQLKLMNDKAHVLIKETHFNKRTNNLTESMGNMEMLGQLVIKKLLKSNEMMAKKWNIPVEQVRLDLRMIDKKPEVRILEEDGERYLDMIL